MPTLNINFNDMRTVSSFFSKSKFKLSRRLPRVAHNDIQKELIRERPIFTKKLFKQSSRIELIEGDGLAVKTSLSQGKKFPIRLTQNGWSLLSFLPSYIERSRVFFLLSGRELSFEKQSPLSWTPGCRWQQPWGFLFLCSQNRTEARIELLHHLFCDAIFTLPRTSGWHFIIRHFTSFL